jgi:hypothetical protein
LSGLKGILENQYKSYIFAEKTGISMQKENLAENWSNNNYHLFTKHRGEWVAYNHDDGIIAYGKDLTTTSEIAESTGKWFALKYVNPVSYAGLRRL